MLEPHLSEVTEDRVGGLAKQRLERGGSGVEVYWVASILIRAISAAWTVNSLV